MGPWDHLWSHGFQLWGKQATLEIYSPLEKMIIIIVQKQAWWLLSGILRNSKFGNSTPTSKNYTEAKRGESSEKVSKIWK